MKSNTMKKLLAIVGVKPHWKVRKMWIANKMREIMKHKSIDKIRVTEICKAAEIERPTFYYHFKDIYDLVEWSCEEDARKAIEGNKTYGTWEQGFLNVFYAVRDNKPFILNV